MRILEMVNCLHYVADNLNKYDGNKETAGDLKKIANYIQTINNNKPIDDLIEKWQNRLKKIDKNPDWYIKDMIVDLKRLHNLN